jgi:hypothetical protein
MGGGTKLTHAISALALVAVALQGVPTVPAAPAFAAEQQAADPAQPVVAPAVPNASAAAAIILPRDTPIHLITLTEVTTKTDTIGHRFKLRVNQPVIIGGATVIPVGALAWGEVTTADSSGNLGKAGSLTARLLYVEYAGQKIPISGDTSAKGRTGTAETVVGVLSLGLLGLFAKGNNAKIKAGEKITAFVTDDVTLAAPTP